MNLDKIEGWFEELMHVGIALKLEEPTTTKESMFFRTTRILLHTGLSVNSG